MDSGKDGNQMYSEKLILTFGVRAADLSEGFWFFPVANGGMETRNPVVPLINMRQDFRYTLERIIEKAKEKEDAAYSQAKVIMMATTLAMVSILEHQNSNPAWD